MSADRSAPNSPRSEAAAGSVVRNVVVNWLLPVAVVLALVVGMQWFNKPPVQLGDDGGAPEFSLTDSEGKSVRLSDFRGQKVLLNFWEEWCGPCRKEMPALNAFARNHPDVVVLGLASDPGTDLPAAKRKLKIQFRVVRSTSSVNRSYGVNKVPTTFLIDEEGKVLHSHLGKISTFKLNSWLRGSSTFDCSPRGAR